MRKHIRFKKHLIAEARRGFGLPDYPSRDIFELTEWIGDLSKRPVPIYDKALADFYAIGDDGEIPF